MSNGYLRRETIDHIELWTLNQPDTRNAISDFAMIDAILESISDVNGNNDIRAVILTGSGKSFSSGGNLAHMRQRQGLFAGTPNEKREGYRHRIQLISKALYNCEVPTIAAVNGHAFGAGCDLSLMCDMRIASSAAKFAMNFAKLGLIPGSGGGWFLPRIIGHARAAEMVFTGDAVDADTALEWGLVSAVVAPDELLPRAMELANRISSNPSHALRMGKRLLREGARQELDSLLELAAAMQALAHTTADHDEALTALVDRRSPLFLNS
ncbi:enoyl-CoA hydratase/carnithine racemase [Rhodococcus sp. 27YEA15]|uniref:crotonase/enoyl-CoA hydratase family protein n=1 Tax=Rhodococcus sp. 27YEA15 TaxID=3156259 RepID=UPI003C79A56A